MYDFEIPTSDYKNVLQPFFKFLLKFVIGFKYQLLKPKIKVIEEFLFLIKDFGFRKRKQVFTEEQNLKLLD